MDRTPIASETHRNILENINIEMEALGDYSLSAMLSCTMVFFLNCRVEIKLMGISLCQLAIVLQTVSKYLIII